MAETKTFVLSDIFRFITGKENSSGISERHSPCNLRSTEECPFKEMIKDRKCGNCTFALEDQQVLAQALVGSGYSQSKEPTHMSYMPDLYLYSEYIKGDKKVMINHFDKRVNIKIV